MEREIGLWIKAHYGELRPSEKKVADYILEHMEELRTLSIDRLAACCQVSQPTVMRTVRALGYDGYRDFRYAVVEQLAQQGRRKEDGFRAMYGYSLTGEEKTEDIPARIVAATGKMAEEMLKNVSGRIFCKVIEILSRARRVDLYSVENSNVTAQDLLTKLLYLGLDCRHFDDGYHQRISAGNLEKGNAAVGISYSGNSRDTVEAVKMAKRAGASTIVMTNFQNSLITRYADFVLCTSQEQAFYGDAIFSRTTQLMLVDMIYMGLLASDFKRYIQSLNRNSRIVRDKEYPVQERTDEKRKRV